MTVNQNTAKKNMEKLSSGQRINRAGDDAAGLAISEKMRGQIRGLEQAETNAQDGISLIQTAEGALNETHAILQRMRELSVQSANDTNTAEDRVQLQNEVDQLSNEITRIAKDTTFNNSNLLDGSFDGKFHIGANAGQDLSVQIGKMDSVSLKTTGSVKQDGLIVINGTGEPLEVQIEQLPAGVDIPTEGLFDDETNVLTITLGRDGQGNVLGESAKMLADKFTNDQLFSEVGIFFSVEDGKGNTVVNETGADNLKATIGISISTQQEASDSMTFLDGAINVISAERAKMGAIQNRLEHTINNLSTSAENLTAAESRIRDVDMAKEMMEMTKNNILQQAAQSMLAQANQTPQNVLQLLR